jgi:outer membrane protein OmpA-like peptidoglycan-associated protein
MRRCRYVRLLILAGVALVALPGRAQAEDLFILKKQKHLLELGVYAGLLVPSRAHEFYEKDPPANTQQLETVAPDIGLRLGYLPISWIGAELEAGVMPTSTERGFNTLLYHVRGHLLVQYPARLAPFLVVGGGLFGSSSDDEDLGDDPDAAFHWGVGLKLYAHPKLVMRLDARHIVGPRIGTGRRTSHFEGLLGMSYIFGVVTEPKDSDGDGVTNDKDKCPNEAGKRADGCPWGDSDNDGLTDDKDKCPKVAGVKDYQGCPVPDTDGDGVKDDVDQCPKVKGHKDYKGCVPPDTDGDGLTDDKDKCPKVKGEARHQGCPPPDKDQDGIPDDKDKCPDKPETKNGYQDTDGCPDTVPKIVKRFTGAIKGIYFATGKAKIRRASFGKLNKAVAVLKKYPGVKLEIGGYTDSTGKRKLNVALSKKRAEAVRDYLVKKGVATERLTAIGYGPDKPVADNKTRKGRAKNRRIEFKLVVR